MIQQPVQRKFAVVVPGASFGHLAPVLPIMQQLAQEGHQVTFYIYKRHFDKISLDKRIRVYEIPTSFDLIWRLQKYEKWQQSRFGKMLKLKQITSQDFTWYAFLSSLQFRQLQTEVHPVKWQIVKDIEQMEPDIIIYDAFEAWTGEIAENYCHMHKQTKSVQVYGLPIQDIRGSYKSASPVKRFSIKVLSFSIRLMLLYAKLAYNQKKASEGLTYMQGEERGEYNIIGVPTQFQPKLHKYQDKRFHYYGYLKQNLSSGYSFTFPYQKLKHGRTIFVTLGSISIHENVLFKIIKDTLIQDHYRDYQIVMTVPSDIKEEMGSFPDNFVVQEFVPQLQILQYCCLAICHCGINTILEAIATNVPIVGTPQRGVGDREDNGKILKQLGLGEYEITQTLNSNKLDAMVKRVLNDRSYLENVKNYNNQLLEGGGVQRAIQELELLAARE